MVLVAVGLLIHPTRKVHASPLLDDVGCFVCRQAQIGLRAKGYLFAVSEGNGSHLLARFSCRASHVRPHSGKIITGIRAKGTLDNVQVG